jgi:hypothetical protein
MFRVLRPKGRIYVTTPNSAYIIRRLQLLSGRTVYTTLPDWIGGLPHARHAREYTFSEARTLLEHVGFRVVHEQSRHFHLSVGRSSALASLGKLGIDRLARVRRTLGPEIIIVAERP